MAREVDLTIPLRPFAMRGTFTLPDRPRGMVLFTHGRGSGPSGTRNHLVAQALRNAELGTLLLDLLSPEEGRVDDRTHLERFDIDLLAGRLIIATDWLQGERSAREIGVGYFGAGAGAAVALLAASARSSIVKAVVSENGHPELTGPALATIHTPTLFLVDERHRRLIDPNRSAHATVAGAEKGLQIIPCGDSSLAAAEKMTEAAIGWFGRFLPSNRG